MKITKRYHLVRIPQIPMLAIRSFYFNRIRSNNNNDVSIKMAEGFDAGYFQCLKDLGIDKKYAPKGLRQ